ncbi:hypothetical protein OIV83_003295 [Microbotryomycetes sp. JL201]|nr:hypothetical protein OIV83_003295 [Microbotryomycetes sp. JL201]
MASYDPFGGRSSSPASSSLSHKPSLSVLIRTSTVPNSPADSLGNADEGEYDLPDVDPLDGSVFRAPEFDASEFLLTRRHTALDELRSELRAYQATLKSQLVAVINTEYEAFIGLSIGLRQANVSQSLATIKRPVLSIKSEVTRVKQELEGMRKDMADLLEQRKHLRETKSALRRLLETEQAVEKVEGLLKIGDASLTGTKERESIERSLESPARRIERVASEYSHMLYLVSKAGDSPFIQSLEPRLSKASSVLHLELEQLLVHTLKTAQRGDGESKDSLISLLRTYSALSAVPIAEQIVRKTLVAPRVSELVTRAALTDTNGQASAPTPCEDSTTFYSYSPLSVSASSSTETIALKALYERMLDFVTQDCGLVLQVAESLLGPNVPTIDLTSSTSSLDGVDDVATRPKQQYFLLANVLWDEIGNRLMSELGSTIFAAGRPTIFHAHYTLTMQFLSRLENMCPSLAYLEALRSHPTYTNFVKRFQLPVYFQLRLKELVTSVERAFEVGSVSGGGSSFVMTESEAVLRALKMCWHEEVYLEELSGRFWRLTLQLLSRYRTWIDSVVPKYVAANGNLAANGGGANSGRASFDADRTRVPSRPSTPGQGEDVSEDAILRQLTALVADARMLCEKVKNLYEDRIRPRLPEPGDGQSEYPESDVLELSLAQLSGVVPPLSSQIVTILVKRCAEHLKHVRSVASQVRASTRKGPAEPSFFVSNILKELRAYLHGPAKVVDDTLQKQWATSVAEEVASRYATILSTQKKTEDSYRWYKKGRQGLSFFRSSTPTPQPATEDEQGDKVRMQMQLDAETLARDARSLGVDVDGSEPFKSLTTAITDGAVDETKSTN